MRDVSCERDGVKHLVEVVGCDLEAGGEGPENVVPVLVMDQQRNVEAGE